MLPACDRVSELVLVECNYNISHVGYMAEDGTCGFQGTFLFLDLLRQGTKVLRNPYSDQRIEINSEPISTLGVSKETTS